MNNLFDQWCKTTEETDGRKTLWRAKENKKSRSKVIDEIARRTRSHYVDNEEIANFLEILDYQETANILRELYPEKKKGKSADLGEILCTEVIEEWCDHVVPIRKLRDKDHREQAMRGEDVIGVTYDDDGYLCLLKAEAKSAISLANKTVVDARLALENNFGRPTAHALIFIARRILDENDANKKLAKDLFKSTRDGSIKKHQITHCLFVLTGKPAKDMLDDDYAHVDASRPQYIIQIYVPNHANLVAEVYDKVNNLEVS